MKKTICALLAATMLFSLCACSQSGGSAASAPAMSIKPTEFSEETQEVLELFDDEIQFFDISLDETAKSYTISIWVYQDGEWIKGGQKLGSNEFLGKRITVRLTETSCDIYNIYGKSYAKGSYSDLDTPFDDSVGIASVRIDREISIELNTEIPIWVKIGTTSYQMEVFDITGDFRELACNAGIAVTLTVSDQAEA